MKIIPRDSKILSITHSDCDGVSCQIVLGNVYKNITYVDCSFYKIDDYLSKVKFDEYDYVFLTDIYPDKRSNLYLSDNIILLDHHNTAMEYLNPKKLHFVVTGICGALLTKRFVEKMYNIKLTHLDKLIELTNDYDMWVHKYPESKILNDLMFYYYKSIKFRQEFFNGRTTFTEEELKWYEGRELKYKELYDKLNVYEFETINGVLVQSDEFVNEISHDLMTKEKYNVVFIQNPNLNRLSVRHNIEGFDVGSLLKNLGLGGGHPFAAGMNVKDMNKLSGDIATIEKEIANKFPIVRRKKV